MTVDTLLKSDPILGSKSQKIGMVCAKVPVDTLLGGRGRGRGRGHAVVKPAHGVL